MFCTGPVGQCNFKTPLSSYNSTELILATKWNEIIQKSFSPFVCRHSHSVIGPVQFILHWSGGPVGWKCQF